MVGICGAGLYEHGTADARISRTIDSDGTLQTLGTASFPIPGVRELALLMTRFSLAVYLKYLHECLTWQATLHVT